MAANAVGGPNALSEEEGASLRWARYILLLVSVLVSGCGVSPAPSAFRAPEACVCFAGQKQCCPDGALSCDQNLNFCRPESECEAAPMDCLSNIECKTDSFCMKGSCV